MSSTLYLRGGFIRHAVIQDDESGVFVRANCSAEPSNEALEQMGWSFGEGCSSGKLKGRLTASQVMFTPNGELAKHEINIEATEVSNFVWVEVKDRENDTTNIEVRFQVRTIIAGASLVFENFKRMIGDDGCQVRITYEANHDSQQDLPLGKKADDRQSDLPLGEEVNCVDCANDVPFTDDTKSLHVSNQPCKLYKGHEDGSAPLAPAAVMGGSHQRRKRGQIADPPAAAEPEAVTEKVQ